MDSDSCGFGFEPAGFGSGFGFEMPGFAHHWRWSTYSFRTKRTPTPLGPLLRKARIKHFIILLYSFTSEQAKISVTQRFKAIFLQKVMDLWCRDKMSLFGIPKYILKPNIGHKALLSLITLRKKLVKSCEET